MHSTGLATWMSQLPHGTIASLPFCIFKDINNSVFVINKSYEKGFYVIEKQSKGS